jgi:hypothetical protein
VSDREPKVLPIDRLLPFVGFTVRWLNPAPDDVWRFAMVVDVSKVEPANVLLVREVDPVTGEPETDIRTLRVAEPGRPCDIEIHVVEIPESEGGASWNFEQACHYIDGLALAIFDYMGEHDDDPMEISRKWLSGMVTSLRKAARTLRRRRES